MYCTNCGVKLADDATFCPNCGTPRWQDAIDDPYSDAALAQRGMKLCVSCRSEIPRAATRCDRCDADQPPPGQGGYFPQPQPQFVPPVTHLEQVALPESRFASIPRRVAAFLIDLIVVVVLVVTVLIIIELLTGKAIATSESNSDNDTLILSLFLYLAYFIFAEGIGGQTVGKRLTDIRVVRPDGSQASWGQSIARNLLRIIDSLPFFYIVGLILMSTSPQNQRLGDRAAGTVVLYEPRPKRPQR